MQERFEMMEKAIAQMAEEKKYATLRDILLTMNPADIAAIFTSIEEARLPLLFRLLPKELAAETFVEMETDAQELLIRGFSYNALKEIVDELYADDAASSLGSRRNSRGIWRSSRSRNSSAMSLGFMVTRMSRRVAYFLSSSILISAFSKISNFSAMVFLLFYKIEGNTPIFRDGSFPRK